MKFLCQLLQKFTAPTHTHTHTHTHAMKTLLLPHAREVKMWTKSMKLHFIRKQDLSNSILFSWQDDTGPKKSTINLVQTTAQCSCDKEDI